MAHLGYTLVPVWMKGFPGRFLAVTVSRSDVMHVWSTPKGEIVTRCNRYGLSVKVWKWCVATYADSPKTFVVRLESELAMAVLADDEAPKL
jgi:hypothetical protein